MFDNHTEILALDTGVGDRVPRLFPTNVGDSGGVTRRGSDIYIQELAAGTGTMTR